MPFAWLLIIGCAVALFFQFKNRRFIAPIDPRVDEAEKHFQTIEASLDSYEADPSQSPKNAF